MAVLLELEVPVLDDAEVVEVVISSHSVSRWEVDFWNCPAGHAVQSLSLSWSLSSRASLSLYVPAGHSWQLAEPFFAANRPSEHTAQVKVTLRSPS